MSPVINDKLLGSGSRTGGVKEGLDEAWLFMIFIRDCFHADVWERAGWDQSRFLVNIYREAISMGICSYLYPEEDPADRIIYDITNFLIMSEVSAYQMGKKRKSGGSYGLILFNVVQTQETTRNNLEEESDSLDILEIPIDIVLQGRQLKYPGRMIENIKQSIKKFNQRNIKTIEISQPKVQGKETLQKIFINTILAIKGLDKQMQKSSMSEIHQEFSHRSKTNICIKWKKFKQDKIQKAKRIIKNKIGT